MGQVCGVKSTIEYFIAVTMFVLRPLVLSLSDILGRSVSCDVIVAPRLGFLVHEGDPVPPIWVLYEVGPPITENSFAGPATVGVTVTVEVWSRRSDYIIDFYEALYQGLQRESLFLNVAGGLDDPTAAGPIQEEQGGIFFRHSTVIDLACGLDMPAGLRANYQNHQLSISRVVGI